MLEDVHERSAIYEFDAGLPRVTADKLAWRDVMGEEMPYFADQIICAVSPPDAEGIQAAKDWIKERGYTSEDVSLKKSETAVYVQAKRELA